MPSGASRWWRCAASAIVSPACSNCRSRGGWRSAPRGSRQPARIEAALSAPEVDFDRAYALVQDMFAGALAGTALEWPREGTLALNIARSSVAGVAVQRSDINLRFDARALDIERLAIADFGGASVTAKGSIDISTRAPRGTVTLEPHF